MNLSSTDSIPEPPTNSCQLSYAMSFQLRSLRSPSRRLTDRSLRAVECRVTRSRATIGELLKIVEDTNRGLQTTESQRRAIDQCVEELQRENEDSVTTGQEMSATWKMLWTTEKVAHYYLKKEYIPRNFSLFSETAVGSTRRRETCIRWDQGCAFVRTVI